MALTNKSYLARGKRGIVSTATYRGKTVVVKERNPKAATDTIANEARMLKIVNAENIGPAFIALKGNLLIREYIDGSEVQHWLPAATKEQTLKMLRNILLQCRKMDKLGINKQEMTRPFKHIIMRGSQPVQIDFERAHESARPQNVTQVCQWMTSKRMSAMLIPKGILLPRKEILQQAQQYKRAYSETDFKQIVSSLRL